MTAARERAIELRQIVAELLVTLKVLGGYPPAEVPPEVILLPRGQLEERVCGAPCGVQAAYIVNVGVLLADDLPLAEPRTRAILLHELVHHAQDAHGRFAEADPCVRWRLRESEAYAVQNRYLRRHGLLPVTLVVPPSWLGGACAGD